MPQVKLLKRGTSHQMFRHSVLVKKGTGSSLLLEKNKRSNQESSTALFDSLNVIKTEPAVEPLSDNHCSTPSPCKSQMVERPLSTRKRRPPRRLVEDGNIDKIAKLINSDPSARALSGTRSVSHSKIRLVPPSVRSNNRRSEVDSQTQRSRAPPRVELNKKIHRVNNRSQRRKVKKSGRHFKVKSISNGEVFSCQSCEEVLPDRKTLKPELSQPDSKNDSKHKDNQEADDKEPKREAEQETMISCRWCEKKFHSISHRSIHFRKTHKHMDLVCKECGKVCTGIGGYSRHLASHQVPPEVKLTCKVCGVLSQTKREATNHSLVHAAKTKLCSICGKAFSRTGHMHYHEKVHSDIREFACELCDKSYKYRIDLVRHIFVHSGELPYQCTYCDAKFNRPSTLKSHIRTHTDERPYFCSFCERKFKTCSDMRRHEYRHGGKKKYKCSQCDWKFSTNGEMTRHVRVMHNPDKPKKLRPFKGGYKCRLEGVKQEDASHEPGKQDNTILADVMSNQTLKQEEDNSSGTEDISLAVQTIGQTIVMCVDHNRKQIHDVSSSGSKPEKKRNCKPIVKREGYTAIYFPKSCVPDISSEVTASTHETTPGYYTEEVITSGAIIQGDCQEAETKLIDEATGPVVGTLEQEAADLSEGEVVMCKTTEKATPRHEQTLHSDPDDMATVHRNVQDNVCQEPVQHIAVEMPAKDFESKVPEKFACEVADKLYLPEVGPEQVVDKCTEVLSVHVQDMHVRNEGDITLSTSLEIVEEVDIQIQGDGQGIGIALKEEVEQSSTKPYVGVKQDIPRNISSHALVETHTITDEVTYEGMKVDAVMEKVIQVIPQDKLLHVQTEAEDESVNIIYLTPEQLELLEQQQHGQGIVIIQGDRQIVLVNEHNENSSE